MENPALLIVTADEVLFSTLGGKLREWGADVFHHAPSETRAMPKPAIDVILVDVRRHAAQALQFLGRILTEMPGAEAILINNNDNIGASMEGMRTGATDELLVPFDTRAVERAVNAACRRSALRRKKKEKPLLLAVFEEAMTAAAFAEAGELDTAREILSGSVSRQNSERQAAGKEDNPKT